MNNNAKRILVLLGFLSVGSIPFIPAISSGLSFLTFHALGGLMPFKVHIARCFLQAQYPLWNPFIIAGAPFHSGIGILDPFIIFYFFLRDWQAMLVASYAALCFSGVTMYLYLHKGWKMAILPSLLGGMLFMLNPFFAATSHEFPFMAPPVYLPCAFLFYLWGIERRSWKYFLSAGLFLSLSFFSGNLESFYFILLFFCSAQVLRVLIQGSTDKPFGTRCVAEIKCLVVTIAWAFAFAAIDLLPTIEMIFNSERSENGILIQNFVHFSEVIVFSWAAVSLYDYMTQKKGVLSRFLPWVGCFGILLLFTFQIDQARHFFSLTPNLFYPDVSKVMIDGVESFQMLQSATGLTRESLTSFFDPRFVFYIQPPIYLFTLSSLLLFSFGLAFGSQRLIRAYAWMAVSFALYAFTAVPNLNDRFLGFRAIAYPRIMFPFFFLLSVVIAHALNDILKEAQSKTLSFKPFQAITIVVLGLSIYLLFPITGNFNDTLFRRMLEKFDLSGVVANQWIERSLVFLQMELEGLKLLTSESLQVWFLLIASAFSLFFLFCFLSLKRSWCLCLLVISMIAQTVLCWNLYAFQKHDLQLLQRSSPEIAFLRNIKSTERMATHSDPAIQLQNYYDEEHFPALMGNFPGYWGVQTIEGSALNLSPKLFGEFWELEPMNSYTPSILNQFPSKIYDLMSMRYLFSDSLISEASFRKIGKGKRYYIYENLKVLPRFYFAGSVGPERPDEIKKQILDSEWDPRRLTLIEGTVPSYFESRRSRHNKEDINPKIVIAEERYNSLLLETASPKSEFLVTADAYNKHWRVYVDGMVKPIVKSNFYFKGVFLPAGEHLVKFVYFSWVFIIGMCISLSALGFLLIAFLPSSHKSPLGDL